MDLGKDLILLRWLDHHQEEIILEEETRMAFGGVLVINKLHVCSLSS